MEVNTLASYIGKTAASTTAAVNALTKKEEVRGDYVPKVTSRDTQDVVELSAEALKKLKEAEHAASSAAQDTQKKPDVNPLDAILASYNATFNSADANRDGILDAQEVQAAIANFVKDFSDEAKVQISAQLSSDFINAAGNDYQLTREELNNYLTRIFNGESYSNFRPEEGSDGEGKQSSGADFISRAMEMFRQADRGGDGVVSAEEFYATINEAAKTMGPEEQLNYIAGFGNGFMQAAGSDMRLTEKEALAYLEKYYGDTGPPSGPVDTPPADSQATLPPATQQFFDKADSDNDGLITYNEFQDWLDSVVPKAQEGSLAAVINGLREQALDWFSQALNQLGTPGNPAEAFNIEQYTKELLS